MYTPIIPAFEKLTQEGHEFKASLSYMWASASNKPRAEDVT
jgi:hypothetical protein